ncbi:MAG TPA: malto-oligosyltrehalose synthase, partial [Gemmatimonadales bacterium]|nr:malto-oligosyltrehalose synthase [Gemmatimonadales bacterium]
MPPILSTYRLQLHAGFPLVRARELVPYLHRLGITHIHCSPILQARRGSTHGYDVADPTRLNTELGSEEDLAGLAADLKARDMGLVLDIVPNHMAASSENPAWEDVLMHGPASAYARWFDVEWRATERELRFRVMLPVLGDQRTRVLQRNEISVGAHDGQVRVQYYEHSFPLDPSTLPPVLERAFSHCDRLLPDDEFCRILRQITDRLRRLPRRSNRRPAAIARRREIAAAELSRLRELCQTVPEIAEAVGIAAEEFGSGRNGPMRLRRLLDSQVYRLVYWRRAARELNYRRFFDVNDLIALHMEDPQVFTATHSLILEWKHRGWIDGFRIDHPDGLLDPREYFQRLADAAFGPSEGRPPIFVEKILSPAEWPRRDWPVAGTTGYDFLNQTEGLFISPDGYAAIEQEYRRIIRQPLEFSAIARLAKRRVLESALSAGVRRLAERLLKLSAITKAVPAIKVHALAVAIVETIASLPVYRTYVDSTTPVARGEDRKLLEAALSDARQRGRAQADALDLLAAALLGTEEALRDPEVEGVRLRFVQRFQQVSGPATAKGIEDTAFYSYAPLLSRNEVGGGPDTDLARAVADFHAANCRRATEWPGTMLAATTHDTKRTADVRSRLDVLSELPAEWAHAVESWRRINLAHKHELNGQRAPDPNTVYHVLQAIVGVWPRSTQVASGAVRPDEDCVAALRERLVQYSLKAAREAKVKTSWTDPDQEFEAALQHYVESVLTPELSSEFLADLSNFVRRIGRHGMWNALSRALLHLTSPGVPDLYQGDELWNFALVDPDNRRPVQYDVRARLLEVVEAGPTEDDERRDWLTDLVAQVEDGRLKLHLIRTVLHLRRHDPQLFLTGSYTPLNAEGPSGHQVIGFARQQNGQRAIVLAPRLLASRLSDPDKRPTSSEIWEGTYLPLPPLARPLWRK